MKREVLRRVENKGEYYYHKFMCPGCEFEHSVWLEGPKAWRWNGCMTKPSVYPSIKTEGVLDHPPEVWLDYERGKPLPEPVKYLCHSFIVQGRIQFLDDCTHSLRGWHDLPVYKPQPCPR